MLVVKQIPKEKQDSLLAWRNEKDYSFIKNITIEEYLVEVEERLELYHSVLFFNEDFSGDLRWKKLNRKPFKKNISVSTLTDFKKTGKIEWEPKEGEVTKGDIFNNSSRVGSINNDVKITAQLKETQRATSWRIETESVVPIKGDDLHTLLKRKELIDQKSNDSAPSLNENIYEHTNQSQYSLSQKQYLFPFQKDKKQVLFSLDLESSNDELLKQIAAILPNLREKIGLPEPIKKEGYQSQLKSLRTFIDYKVIEYLDILLYCSMESPRSEQWKVSDALLCDLLFCDDESPDGEKMKKIRTRFYTPKLLNPDYTTDLFTNIRSERSDTQLPIDYLFI